MHSSITFDIAAACMLALASCFGWGPTLEGFNFIGLFGSIKESTVSGTTGNTNSALG